jgi:hypothetical protein
MLAAWAEAGFGYNGLCGMEDSAPWKGSSPCHRLLAPEILQTAAPRPRTVGSLKVTLELCGTCTNNV